MLCYHGKPTCRSKTKCQTSVDCFPDSLSFQSTQFWEMSGSLCVFVCACMHMYTGLGMGLGISEHGTFQGADSILGLVMCKSVCDGKQCQLVAMTPPCTPRLVLQECDHGHTPPCLELGAAEHRLGTLARGKTEVASLCSLSVLQRWDEAVEMLLGSWSMRSCNWPVFCGARWG